MLVLTVAWEVCEMGGKMSGKGGSWWVLWIEGVVKGVGTDVPSLDGGDAVVKEEGEDRCGGVKSREEEGVLPVGSSWW